MDAARPLDDHDLLRFCRARKFDTKQVRMMLLKHAKWRIDEKADNIENTFDFSELPTVQKAFPFFYHGVDRDGNPIHIE